MIDRRDLVSRLEKCIIGPIVPTGSLVMFGSSVNGFGSFDCELDLTLITYPTYYHGRLFTDKGQLMDKITDTLTTFGGIKGMSVVSKGRFPMIKV